MPHQHQAVAPNPWQAPVHGHCPSRCPQHAYHFKRASTLPYYVTSNGWLPTSLRDPHGLLSSSHSDPSPKAIKTPLEPAQEVFGFTGHPSCPTDRRTPPDQSSGATSGPMLSPCAWSWKPTCAAPSRTLTLNWLADSCTLTPSCTTSMFANAPSSRKAITWQQSFGDVAGAQPLPPHQSTYCGSLASINASIDTCLALTIFPAPQTSSPMRSHVCSTFNGPRLLTNCSPFSHRPLTFRSRPHHHGRFLQ
jgi:hypothetical protein